MIKSSEERLDDAKKKQNKNMITRENILASAKKLALSGSRISMRAIAKENNCAPPSMYYYFKNKKAIFSRLFEDLFVKENVIDFTVMESYLKKHTNMFNAMFSSGENININQYLKTEYDQNHAESIIGRLILSGGK